MNSYQKILPGKSLIKKSTKPYVAEPLEAKVRRMFATKQPIEGNTELIYQERKDGVQAAYNIRTDRWEKALEGKEAIEKSNRAKRELKMGEASFDTMTPDQQTNFIKKFPNSKFAAKPPAK